MATPPSPLPISVPSPGPNPREREYLNTLQDATRTLFARAPQASGLRQQAGLQLTSSTLGSNGQPTPLTDLQLQQQAGAFPEKQPGRSQGGKLDLSRSTLGQTEREALIEAILRYQELLVQLGHGPEAQAISSSLVAARRVQRRLSMRPSSMIAPINEHATGLDILLKEGFLAFLQRLTPHLPPMPQQVVKFKNVSYTSDIRRTAKGYATVGSKLVDCFAPCLKEKAPIETYHVLDDCTGYLMPGTLTLVLGPPGCGKSSFHQALAGRLWTNKTTKLTGEVTYNHLPVAETQYRRLATYIGQTDKHLPTLTVRETCDFARDCTTGSLVTDESHREDLAKLAGPWGKHMKTEVILNLMGLGHAGNTIIGDRVRRGVSGGERHRVTTAEMLCGTYIVFFFDEISTGLDSSATYDIVSVIRTLARTSQTTNLFSLLQPSPEVFDLFDRLVLLDEGRIVYQGPREDVLPYFAKLGYFKPKHVDVADFLQEVTTEAGRIFLQSGFPPLDNAGFAAAYKASQQCLEVKRVVESPHLFREVGLYGAKPLGLVLEDGKAPDNLSAIAAVEPHGSLAGASVINTDKPLPGDTVTAVTGPSGSLEFLARREGVRSASEVEGLIEASVDPVRIQVQRPVNKEMGSEWATFLSREFVQPLWDNTKTVFRRQFKVATRNTAFIFARLFQVLFLGAFTGTVFYQLSKNPTQTDMDLRKSISFIAVLAMSLGAMAQIPNQLDERVVFYKHQDARFFRAKSYAMALVISGIPFSFMEIAVYCPLLYFLTGLSLEKNGAHFFIFLLIVFVAALFGSALVRLLAAVAPSREAAGGMAGLFVILLLLFSGFLIVKSKIPPWWIWVYYINPLQYAYTSIVLNEFLSGEYDYPCSDPRVDLATATFCRGRPDTSVAEAYLAIYKFPKGFGQVWAGIGVLLAYYVFLTGLTFIAMERIRYPEVKNPPTARSLPATAANGEDSTSKAVESNPSPPPAKANPIIDPAKHSSGSRNGRSVESGEAGDVELGGLPARAKSPVRASGLAFLPITLSFHDIVYEIDIPGVHDPRILLNYVSGYAKPGTMTALMGSSGAGKTTLLDVLAGRKTTGRIRGDILINGHPKVQETFARVMGYCEQNDIHTPYATVYESLLFSAHLRLPRSTSPPQRIQFVKEVMDLLELWPQANDLVGFIGSGGLSVEQAKRLTIGVELVSNPSVLFLDEPTSGLDSRAAQRVITGIQNIVSTGRSVICTIHQPSRRLFLAFDNLLLLKRGGEVVFFGELGHESKNLLAYFESLPGVPKCGDNQNPATYMLEVIGAGIGHDALRDFALDYKNSELADLNYEELERLRWSAGKAGPNITEKGYAATWSVIAKEVLMRMQVTYWRNVSYSFGRITFAIILGVLLGSIFWQVKYDNVAGVASRTGMIYISVVFYSIINANNVIPQVNAERPLFYREKAAQMYPSILYSVSWGLAEVPYLALSTLIFCAIALSMVDVAMDSAASFFSFWFLFFEYAASITFFGLMLAHATPNAETASIIIPLVINVWNIVSGFMIPKNNIPVFWRWLYYTSPTAFTLNGLLSIAFHCDTGTAACNISGCYDNPGVCPDCSCPRIRDQGNVITWTSLSTGRSLDYGKRFTDMGVMIVFIVVFRVAAYLALVFIKHNKR